MRALLCRLDPATAFGIALGLIFVLVTLCTGALITFALHVMAGVVR